MRDSKAALATFRENFAQGLAEALQPVQIDVRDRWPSELTSKNYLEGNS